MQRKSQNVPKRGSVTHCKTHCVWGIGPLIPKSQKYLSKYSHLDSPSLRGHVPLRKVVSFLHEASLMSPVTLDLVTIKEHFVHKAAGLSADVNKEQLVNVATGAQYARPVRPGQFSVRGLRTGWDHSFTQAASNQRSDLRVVPSGTSRHGASVTGSKRLGAHLASTKCQCVTTWEKTAFVCCAAVRWGPENPQPGPEHPKWLVEPGSQRFLLRSCVRCDWQAHYLVDLREWPHASRWDGSVE